MPTYKYEAMDTSGEEVKDSVDAANEEEAQQKIRQMGYFVTKITEMAGTAKKGKKKGGAKGKRKKGQVFTIGGVSSKALCTFTRQFSTLQDAGLPVLRSLKILEHQMKPGVLKNSLMDVVDDVESGSTLSEAFGKHPKCFDRVVARHDQHCRVEVDSQRTGLDRADQLAQCLWRIVRRRDGQSRAHLVSVPRQVAENFE